MIARILGLETSCDETSASVVSFGSAGRPSLESLVILSQDVHRIFGGVVPELASRAHLESVGPVVTRALADGGLKLQEIDGIAVTSGPGLAGALLVGVMYAKALSWATGHPLIGVNHLEGHLFAPAIESAEVDPPFVALLISGGHTLLLDVPAWGEYRVLGETLDDAAGEAFDKVGAMLGLDYPAGPAIESLARSGKAGAIALPRPMLNIRHGDPHEFDFSFSGLKTAVRRVIELGADPVADAADIARGFQDAALDVLTSKSVRALEHLGYGALLVGGGVACNGALKVSLQQRLAGRARLHIASPRLNTDNAAMIAAAGGWRLRCGERSTMALEVRDRWPLSELSSPQALAS